MGLNALNLNTTSKLYESGGSPSVRFTLTGVNVNALNTDVGTFTGLPAKYIVRRVTVYDASGALTLAALDLRTTTGGGGIALITAFVLSAIAGITSYVDATLATAATTVVQTAASLVVRCVIAQGSAATVSIDLDVEVLI